MMLLPLHLAVMSGKHWTDGVASLYAAHPRAASIPEPMHHWLPLHCAAAATKMNANTTNYNLASVVKALVHHRPECATVVDCYKRLPLHLMGATANQAKLANEEGSAVLDVIRAYPEAVDARDDAGAVPSVMQKLKDYHLHCQWNKDHNDEMSSSIIQKNTNCTAATIMASSCSQEAYSVMSMMSSSSITASSYELELNCSATYVNGNADNEKESVDKEQDGSSINNAEENGGNNIFHSWMIQMVGGGGNGGDEVLQSSANPTTEFELVTMTS